MAINFPSSPTNGQTHTEGGVTWTYDSAKGSWVTTTSGTIAAHTHTFASLTSKPTTIGGYGITDFNSLGDARWSLSGHVHTFASLTSKPTSFSGYGIVGGNWKVLYTNGSGVITELALGASGTVLQSNGASAAPTFVAPAGGVPAGTVLPYAGPTEPTGFIFCFGQAISRTTFAALFAVIDVIYGAGDGSTTFNVPDLRGRVAAGQDDMGGTSANRLTGFGSVDGDVLGDTGGTESHTLTVAEMPAHTHTYAQAASATSAGAENTSNGNTGITGSTGGSGPHNNVQPTIILNYIIKT